MKRLLIFGGTTEGRELAEWCAENGIYADVSVTTDYGARLLGNGELLNVFTGKLDSREMSVLMRSGEYDAVIDATHPYAVEATANIGKACAETGARYYRLLRAECEVSGKCAAGNDELVDMLNRSNKTILSTLGSKEFPVISKVNGCKKRVWCRVLPSEDNKLLCEKYGIDQAHIIEEKPPYSVERNIAHIRRSCAEILVTKECGIKGGYPEKIEAAKMCGIETITVTRPKENGYPFEELIRILTEKI